MRAHNSGGPQEPEAERDQSLLLGQRATAATSQGPAPHTLLLYTAIPNTVTVTGDNCALAVFKNGLGTDTGQVDTLEGAVCVSGISPADLSWVLTLAEQGGLSTELGGLEEQLVQRVADRLCAWESDLAAEAKATKARCVSCWCKRLVPVIQSSEQTGRTVRWWCTQCSGFRT
jgi:hypothetical protein